jgi:hypothetical protein
LFPRKRPTPGGREFRRIILLEIEIKALLS